jgi:hypothetical protein
MSLKAFHLIFITASSALAFGCGVWALKNFAAPEGHVSELIVGLGAFAASAALILYERYFLKKLKNVSYL